MNKVIPELFFEICKKHPDKPALLYKKGGIYIPVNSKELSDKVKNLSGSLQRMGIEKGDKVAILSENRPEWVISDLAIMASGAIVVPLHSTFSSKIVCDILNRSEAKILIVSNNENLNKVLLEHPLAEYLQKIIVVDDFSIGKKENFNGELLDFNELILDNIKTEPQKISLSPDDVCSIIYTSGTTGTPKGVCLTHKNFLSNVEAVNKVIPVEDGDVFLSFLPLSHVLERTTGYYMPLFLGGIIAYAENTKQLPNNLKEVSPTILISVPRIFDKFYDAIWDKINTGSSFQKSVFKWALKQKEGSFRYIMADLFVFKKIRKQLGGKLRLAISGGASLNEKIGKFFSKIGITILEGYGLTETSPVISANSAGDFKFSTVGKAIPGVQIKIGDNKDILVKGEGVFKGYFKNESESKLCFDKDGWLRTGDLGFIDKQGFLTIVGRGKEMIVTSGGKNVWPEPIENLLDEDKFISQSIVIGNCRKFISALIVPDWQEVKIYFEKNNLPFDKPEKMVKNPGLEAIFRARIDKKINPNLSDFEKIRKFQLLCAEFSQDQDELTPTLKLSRHIVEKHHRKTIESMYV
jgi:long-chain acyl-CoA synthetase